MQFWVQGNNLLTVTRYPVFVPSGSLPR